MAESKKHNMVIQGDDDTEGGRTIKLDTVGEQSDWYMVWRQDYDAKKIEKNSE